MIVHDADPAQLYRETTAFEICLKLLAGRDGGKRSAVERKADPAFLRRLKNWLGGIWAWAITKAFESASRLLALGVRAWQRADRARASFLAQGQKAPPALIAARQGVPMDGTTSIVFERR